METAFSNSWLTRLVLRRARLVLAVSLALLVLAGLFGAGAVDKLRSGGFTDPDAESSRAASVLAEQFGQHQANLILLITAPSGASVDDAAVAAVGRQQVRRLAATRGVQVVGSYWGAPATQAAGLRSTDRRRALVLAHVDGDDNAVVDRAHELQPAFTRRVSTSAGPVSIATGGGIQISADINRQVTKDLTRAESIAIPVTLVLMVVVFGSVVAGLLPLLVGGIAVVATLAVLSVLAEVTSVSVFALNLTTALGLGLGIDYSLLVVSRFREELARGREVAEAVAVTMATAGRMVIFSAGTVAVALSVLTLFPLYFLRSFAYAGVAVVAIAAVAAVVTLPALLAVAGRRVELLPVRRRSRRVAPSGVGGRPTDGVDGVWNRLSRMVMRRPVRCALPVLAVLAVLAAPFASISFGLPDDRALPASVSAGRAVGDVLRTEFTPGSAAPVQLVLPQASAAVTAQVAGRVRQVAGVAQVSSTRPGVVQAVLDRDPASASAQQSVRRIRTVASAVPQAGEVLVGGTTASLIDTKTAIADRLPWAGLLIALTTFVLLFAFTGSVVLPLKALLVNAFTIAAVLGVMVWVFQHGHLSGQLGFTAQPLDLTMPLLMFCVTFGLSMDYEVFLLGRIKELHDGGADTTTAVATGLARTGRIITTAAALLSITMLAFVTSRVSFIQMFGLGTALAIVLDATLVRGVLVPAMMRLMGRANWWAPGPLRRLHDRFGLSASTGPIGGARRPGPASVEVDRRGSVPAGRGAGTGPR